MGSDTSRPRRAGRWLLTAALVAATVAGGVVWWERRDAPAPVTDAPVAVRTATVVRTDLVVTRSLTGTLGYGPGQPVKGAAEGVVTWLPRPGAVVERGAQLFRVDDRPVALFYGNMPLYRDLDQPGTVGRDVRIVADNLRAMGYAIGRRPRAGETVKRAEPAPASDQAGPSPAGRERAASGSAGREQAGSGSVRQERAGSGSAGGERITVRTGDGVLTSGLRAAIERWQRDTGLPVTGTLGRGDVVVRPGAVRVDSVTAHPGDSAAEPLLTVTPTAKVITASAEAAEADTIERGDRVTVLLPGDESVPGKVTAVGTAVTTDEDAGTPRKSVTVRVDGDRGLDDLDSAQVQVDLAGETREDVLAVPVGALVALSEGGYAVQVAGGGGLIAVTTGMFAKGLVEVTGDGLAEGTDVVTTS